MEFSSKEDLEAPIETAFEVLNDFESIERSAIRRGVDVKRMDSLDAPGVGMAWNTSFEFRGKKRSATIEIVQHDAPDLIRFLSHSGGLDVKAVIELVALSRTRTRMNFTAVLEPKTLSSRLLTQSLKLAKGPLDKKFKGRISEFARIVESTCKSGV